MARRNQLRDELLEILAKAGATIDHVGQTRGGHQVIRWSLAGRKETSVFASTASDHRTHQNTVSMVKRQVRRITEGN